MFDTASVSGFAARSRISPTRSRSVSNRWRSAPRADNCSRVVSGSRGYPATVQRRPAAAAYAPSAIPALPDEPMASRRRSKAALAAPAPRLRRNGARQGRRERGRVDAQGAGGLLVMHACSTRNAAIRSSASAKPAARRPPSG